MSDSTGLVVIGALLIPASFSMYYIVNSMNDKTLQITTGVVQGVPIPWVSRWGTLMQVQVPATGFAGAFALLMALVFFAIGDQVGDADIRSLARLCAWVYSGASASFLVLGPVAFVGIASRLRKAERD
jgi:hypothetical protein